MQIDPASIPIRLTKQQALIIWRGLNFITNAFQIRETEGTLYRSFPFRIVQLPPGSEGAFSKPLMDMVVRD